MDYSLPGSVPETAMATHPDTLAWKIPWTEEPGGLQSMGSLRVGHNWATSLSLFTFMHWRRKWQRTPVFLPGESQGRGSLVGCRQSMGSHRVGHDWSDLAAAAAVSVHGILQARILEWVAMPSSRVSSQPRDWTHISCVARWILYCWAIREAQILSHICMHTTKLSVILQKILQEP